ncbi:hypothetical protein [Noviluteimonas dokdonensis]|uniref:hypothetical protein n=1 Tax=Noviluteimonas dokdonensis TaxID=414050 RepID=UPI000567BDCE|nr:hypothetical protein [Lysobacter dokdonensis]
MRLDQHETEVFRCRDRYLLAKAAVEPNATFGDLDFVGEFDSSRLAPDVRARIARDMGDLTYALIGLDELLE